MFPILMFNFYKWIILLLLVAFPLSQGCSSIFPSKRKISKPIPAEKKISPKKRAPRKSKKSILKWPVKGKITSRFGLRKGRQHDGIDIAAKKGTKIVAAGSGKVIFSGKGPTGYGNMIIIKHSSNYVTVYAHNSKNRVRVGKRVKKGETIGYVGSTGRSTGPHLHFEIRKKLVPQNPLKYLPRK